MYVTVSLKIELDATASLSQMEQQIGEAGRAAMKEALGQAIQWTEEQQKVCRHLFRPAERCLAQVQGHNVTPALRELAALVGSSWPYETAAGVLKRLSGVQLSDERLRQLTNEQGNTLAKQQQSEAQQVLEEAVSMEQIRTQRAQSQAEAKQEPPQWLQVGLDGGWLPSREKKGGMEGKIGVIATQVEACTGYLGHPFKKRPIWPPQSLISLGTEINGGTRGICSSRWMARGRLHQA
jgi:hypothetical protein